MDFMKDRLYVRTTVYYEIIPTVAADEGCLCECMLWDPSPICSNKTPKISVAKIHKFLPEVEHHMIVIWSELSPEEDVLEPSVDNEISNDVVDNKTFIDGGFMCTHTITLSLGLS